MQVSKGKYEITETSVIEKLEVVETYKYVLSLRATSSGKEGILIMSAMDEATRDKWFDALSECICGILIDEPDLWPDPFRNTIPLRVVFFSKCKGEAKVNGEELIEPSVATAHPDVTFEGAITQYYTLIMLDPDAPSR